LYRNVCTIRTAACARRAGRKECRFNPSPRDGDFVAAATVARATKFFAANRLTLLGTHVFLGSMLQRHTTANSDLTAAPPARVAASLLVLVLITSPNSAGRTDA